MTTPRTSTPALSPEEIEYLRGIGVDVPQDRPQATPTPQPSTEGLTSEELDYLRSIGVAPEIDSGVSASTPERPPASNGETGPARTPGPVEPSRLEAIRQGFTPGPSARRSFRDLISPAEPGSAFGGGPITTPFGPVSPQGIETGLDLLDFLSIPFESSAENLFRSITGTPQDVRSLFGGEARQPLSPFEALETFRERPLLEQVAIGLIDPTLGTGRIVRAPGQAARALTNIREVPTALPAPVRQPAPSARAGVFGQAPPRPAPVEEVPTPLDVLDEPVQTGGAAQPPAPVEETVSPLAQARQQLTETLGRVGRQRGRQAQQQIEQAQLQVRQEENALAQRQMDVADTVDALPQRAVPRLRNFQRLQEPQVSLAPSGEVMEGGLQDILRQFREVLNNPTRADEWKDALLLRSQELGRRSRNFQDQVNAMIAEGVPTEDAINVATRELGGVLPTPQTPLHQLATPYVREALFQEVYTQLADEPLEMRATATALSNALAGRPIPRTPGIRGGSAFSRLQRVFGEELTRTITRERSLEEVIALETRTQQLGLTGFQGRRGPRVEFPSTQTFGSPETARFLPEQGLLSEIQQPLRAEPPAAPFPERAADPRSPAQRDIDLQRFREQTGQAPAPTGPSARIAVPEEAILRQPERPLMPEPPPQPFRPRQPDPRPQAEQEIDLQIFREVTGEADAPTGLSPQIRAKMPELPPDEVLQAPGLWPETTKERMMRWATNAGLTAMDLSNLLRANLATVDLSYLRQQALLIPGNPVEFAQSFRDSLRSVFSADYARNLDQWMKSDPDFRYYDELGLDFLRALDSKVAQDWQRAEDFIVQGGTRPLQRLANRIPWINVSGRAYVTGMNSMNWRIFKGHMRMMHRLTEEAAAGRATLPENFDINRSARQFGAMLADFSGRGPLSGRVLGQQVDLRSTAPFLNSVFFSTRLNVGRLLTPRHLWNGDKFTRQAAWKNMLTGVGTIGGIVQGGAMMGWWETELDPRSSDFMKIRIGNTRIDPWGGFQQFAVLTWRLISTIREENVKSPTTGRESFSSPEELIGRFARNKLAPGISQTLIAWQGKDFIGRDIDRRDWNFWVRQNTPIAVQDIMEAYEAEGLLGVGLSAPSFFGIGVQTFEEREGRRRGEPVAPGTFGTPEGTRR